MFCARCGKEIDDNSTFCPFCGQKTDEPVESGGGIPKPKVSVKMPDKKVIGGIVVIAVVFLIAISFFKSSKISEKPKEDLAAEDSSGIRSFTEESSNINSSVEETVYTVTKTDLENIANKFFKRHWDDWYFHEMKHASILSVYNYWDQAPIFDSWCVTESSLNNDFSGLSEVVRLYNQWSKADAIPYIDFYAVSSNITKLEYTADTGTQVYLNGYPRYNRNGYECSGQTLHIEFEPMEGKPETWGISSITLYVDPDDVVEEDVENRTTEVDYKTLYTDYIENNLKAQPEGYSEEDFFLRCNVVLLDANKDGIPECVVERSLTGRNSKDIEFLEHYIMSIDDDIVLSRKVDSDKLLDGKSKVGYYNNGYLYFHVSETQKYKLSDEYFRDDLEILPEGFVLYNDGDVSSNSDVTASRTVYQRYELSDSGWELAEEHIGASDEYYDAQSRSEYKYEAVDGEIIGKEVDGKLVSIMLNGELVSVGDTVGYVEFEGTNHVISDFTDQYSGELEEFEYSYGREVRYKKYKFELGFQSSLDIADIKWQK